MTKYTLMRGTDSRDNVAALWLLRGPAVGKPTDCAYLGKIMTNRSKEVQFTRIKQITFVKPDFYVFESVDTYLKHCIVSSARRIDTWETP